MFKQQPPFMSVFRQRISHRWKSVCKERVPQVPRVQNDGYYITLVVHFVMYNWDELKDCRRVKRSVLCSTARRPSFKINCPLVLLPTNRLHNRAFNNSAAWQWKRNPQNDQIKDNLLGVFLHIQLKQQHAHFFQNDSSKTFKKASFFLLSWMIVWCAYPSLGN